MVYLGKGMVWRIRVEAERGEVEFWYGRVWYGHVSYRVRYDEVTRGQSLVVQNSAKVLCCPVLCGEALVKQCEVA